MRSNDRRSLLATDGEAGYCSYDDDDLHAAARLRKKRQRLRECLWIGCGVLLISLVGVGLFFATHPWGTKTPAEPTLAKYRHAAVASDVSLCSHIGRQILEVDGGNAVDAAVATLLCMGLADPQSMGIGGGFFMSIYNRTTGKSYSIDARETAPGKATVDMFYKGANSSKGGLAIAVPGEIRGYQVAMVNHGSLSWKQVFLPAVTMATNGFPVPLSLQHALEDFKAAFGNNINETVAAYPQFGKTFINPETKDIYKEGETIKMPELGRTLKVISEEGPDAFYNGSLTQDILREFQDAGSIITAEDLLAYRAKYSDSYSYKLSNNYTLHTSKAPSGGVILLFILGILDGYNFTPSDISSTEKSILTFHRFIEAFKFAYAKRTQLADEDFEKNVTELVANLTSRSYIESIRSQIWDNQTHPYMYYGPTYYQENKTSTAHLSIVDQFGNAVAVTSTVNARFGANVFGNRTGIIWNDEMDDFATSTKPNDFGVFPSPANQIVPGKRPLSSMSPAVFVDDKGDVKMVVGAAGGSRITTATAWVAAQVMWFRENIKEAIDSLRLHHQLLPPMFTYEKGFDMDIIKGLKALGHNATEVSPGMSIVQGITRQDGYLYANSDYRKGGTPDGY
ncbi:glutathione hydrolase 1 proenzyme-like [Dreissena polymorpha]|nr:glutathione hydrolase 1 proenzyme-like [Dreissena polymorpha]